MDIFLDMYLGFGKQNLSNKNKNKKHKWLAIEHFDVNFSAYLGHVSNFVPYLDAKFEQQQANSS